MADMEKLQERLYEKLHRRPAGIDRMDRLWEAGSPQVQLQAALL